MRFADLEFSPHPLLGETPETVAMMARLRASIPIPPEVDRLLPPYHVEWAEMRFPNGHVVSVVRGMLGLHPCCDFETYCATGPERGGPISHATVAEVDAELARIAALPAATGEL